MSWLGKTSPVHSKTYGNKVFIATNMSRNTEMSKHAGKPKGVIFHVSQPRRRHGGSLAGQRKECSHSPTGAAAIELALVKEDTASDILCPSAPCHVRTRSEETSFRVAQNFHQLPRHQTSFFSDMFAGNGVFSQLLSTVGGSIFIRHPRRLLLQAGSIPELWPVNIDPMSSAAFDPQKNFTILREPDSGNVVVHQTRQEICATCGVLVILASCFLSLTAIIAAGLVVRYVIREVHALRRRSSDPTMQHNLACSLDMETLRASAFRRGLIVGPDINRLQSSMQQPDPVVVGHSNTLETAFDRDHSAKSRTPTSAPGNEESYLLSPRKFISTLLNATNFNASKGSSAGRHNVILGRSKSDEGPATPPRSYEQWARKSITPDPAADWNERPGNSAALPEVRVSAADDSMEGGAVDISPEKQVSLAQAQAIPLSKLASTKREEKHESF